MTVTITLTADAAGNGVNFNAGYKAYFAGFTPYELPLFLGPEGGDETTQIMHLDTPVVGDEANTRAVLLEGDDFLYTFANHSVSGTINTIRLARLGEAYDPETGDLVTEDGIVTAMADYITFSGLDFTNAPGIKGEVHAIVAGLMGGGPSGTLVDPQPITDHMWSEAQHLVGSSGGDRYAGTRFGDTVQGMGGSDTLLGGVGFDRIDGGAGADVLTGGAGKDTFVFKTATAAKGDRIVDFNAAGVDKIDLSAIDANVGAGASGNQAFNFIGAEAFHHVAGELRLGTGTDRLFLYGDTNGDGVADFRIVLNGVPDLTDSSFVL